MSDAIVSELLAVVGEKRKAVEEAERAISRSWETNCTYPMTPVPVNLHTANTEQLRNLAGDVLTKMAMADEVSKLLDLPKDPLKIGAFTADQWLTDMKKRAAKITLDSKKKVLDDAEARLQKLVSPEKRREMELLELQKALSM